MVDRRHQTPLPVGGVEVDRLAVALALDQRFEAGAGARGLHRQRIDAARSVDDPGLAAVADNADSPPAGALGLSSYSQPGALSSIFTLFVRPPHQQT